MITEERHLRVLHIVSGDLWAGAEVQLFTLVRALVAEPGVSLQVVLLNHGRLEQELVSAGIQVFLLDETRLNGLQIARRLYRLIRELQPDVIHTHRRKENILGSIAARTVGNTPSLRTVHGAREHPPRWWHLPKRLLYFLDRFCGRYLQCRIISVSEDLARILEKEFPAARIRVIENGIEPETPDKAAASRADDPGTGAGPIRIGYAGRLVPVKRVDLLIETARHIVDHYPDLDASFRIFGDGPLREELERLSSQLGLSGIVSFAGHCEDMRSKLKELDILLLTSDHEGLPMILLEAMALKIPIIAHATGGIPRLLEHGTCGILVHEQEASSYAREIRHLAQTPQNASLMAERALKRVTEHYSARQNARLYREEYLSCLAERKPTPSVSR